MHCTCEDVIHIMEEVAPLSLAEAWDRVGLMVGSRKQAVRRILVALDVTFNVIEEAKQKKADMIICHHPLFMQPLESLDFDEIVSKTAIACAKEHVAVYVAHTNYDSAKDGVNDVLAKTLELSDVEVLRETQIPQAGIGRIGYLSHSMTLPQFTEMIQQNISKNISISGCKEKRVHRVAVCSGAGGDYAMIAAEKGADVLVTGECKYHEALDAEKIGIVVIAAGHFETEVIALPHLVARLQTALNALQYQDVEVLLSNVETTPFKYEWR